MSIKILYDDKELASIEGGSKTVIQCGKSLIEHDICIDATEAITKPRLQNKLITENGEYSSDNHFDGLGTVDIQVQPKLQSKTIIPSNNSNLVTPDSDFDGLSSVLVQSIPLTTALITENGIYEAPEGMYHAQAIVDVKPPTQHKKVQPIEEYQVVEPDDEYYALSSVLVGPIQTEEVTIRSNGEFIPEENWYVSKVIVEVPQAPLYDGTIIITNNK